MSVVRLVILRVSAECVEVLGNVEVVVLLQDTGGAQVMVAGVIVLVDIPPDAEACHPVVAIAIADLHTADEMKFLIPMEMASGTESEAGAEQIQQLFVSHSGVFGYVCYYG